MSRRKPRMAGPQVDQSIDDLKLGRDAYERRAWDDAYQRLALADKAAPLAVEDLERLAMSAYLTSRDDDYLLILSRAHHAYLEAGDGVGAARAAFWLGLRLAFRGETGPATGWLRRAERLLQRDGRACVEQGYLLLPAAEQQLSGGDGRAAYATAGQAAEFGQRFAEPDLITCARHVQGRALLAQEQVEDGLALLDEAMVAVAAGELSPIMTGLIYCSVIDACQRIHALDRARSWTSALGEWCAAQSQLVAFTGTCLVHRAEIMQIDGAWQDALEEARRACATFSKRSEHRASGAAFYQQGDVHRLRGEFEDAEAAYRQASGRGYDPQPGLALLRLAQGHTDTAVTTIRRALSTTEDRLKRVKLLPGYVEIMLAAGDLEAARSACHELHESGERFATAMLRAMAAQATGAVELAGGDPRAALPALRSAFDRWSQADAPYLSARSRELIGRAYRALGDEESAALELDAARQVYQELGAVPDVARLESAASTVTVPRGSVLTRREMEVLRLVAAGNTNKAVAAELGLSEKTIDRHVSNIFDKLDVSSRTAAAAWAYEHKLV